MKLKYHMHKYKGGMMMKCTTCHKPLSEVNLHRSNPMGEVVIWKCEKCLNKQGVMLSKERRDFCNLLKGI